MSEEIIELKKTSYHLKNLYLDPNNYRFVDNKNYKQIDNTQILEERIQKRTRKFIEGNKRENIKDLLASFKANGFMDVDIIQVKDLGNNNYLVLEGNRRIASLKALQEDYDDGIDIGLLNPAIFKSVPFEIHDNEENEKHLIIMGLKHISGNKKWSAVNQAQLIFDFLEPYWGKSEYIEKENQLCDLLGVQKQRLRGSQRAFYLILEYKKSDYGNQFESSNYSIFEEITKRPNIKDWIDWDDDLYKAHNYNNLSRLFSWISITEELNDDEEYEEYEAIISKSVEIRDLAIFIQDENALNEMENHKSVLRGLIASGKIDKQNYEASLKELADGINKLKSYKDMISLDDVEIIENIKKEFLELIPQKSLLNIGQGNFSVCFEYGTGINQFDSIHIDKYKIFKEFTIDKLNKINIFAGFNNSGKTSLLEAIYLLTKQNDITSFLELIRLKNKLSSLNPNWLNQVFDEDIIVSGVFNNVETSIHLGKFEATNIDKRDDYIASYKLDAKVDSRTLNNTIHTFGYETLKRDNSKVEHLCNAIFKSPYFYNLNEILQTYTKSIEYKTEDGKLAINMVIEFIKSIDTSINDIRLSDSNDIKRFIIDSDKFTEKNLDITNYGEGLQRIFEIALSFAYSQNGILCIDEFETAIHNTLLKSFTEFIQKLADMFNVQVFLTSHSKECIDAFVNNDYNNDEISAYFLENINNEIKTKFVKGDRLKYLVENLDLDIRGNTND
jgi:AAA15 family ATPase/GTPase